MPRSRAISATGLPLQRDRLLPSILARARATRDHVITHQRAPELVQAAHLDPAIRHQRQWLPVRSAGSTRNTRASSMIVENLSTNRIPRSTCDSQLSDPSYRLSQRRLRHPTPAPIGANPLTDRHHAGRRCPSLPCRIRHPDYNTSDRPLIELIVKQAQVSRPS
jgi:hypothetical protein